MNDNHAAYVFFHSTFFLKKDLTIISAYGSEFLSAARRSMISIQHLPIPCYRHLIASNSFLHKLGQSTSLTD